MIATNNITPSTIYKGNYKKGGLAEQQALKFANMISPNGQKPTGVLPVKMDRKTNTSDATTKEGQYEDFLGSALDIAKTSGKDEGINYTRDKWKSFVNAENSKIGKRDSVKMQRDIENEIANLGGTDYSKLSSSEYKGKDIYSAKEAIDQFKNNGYSFAEARTQAYRLQGGDELSPALEEALAKNYPKEYAQLQSTLATGKTGFQEVNEASLNPAETEKKIIDDKATAAVEKAKNNGVAPQEITSGPEVERKEAPIVNDIPLDARAQKYINNIDEKIDPVMAGRAKDLKQQEDKLAALQAKKAEMISKNEDTYMIDFEISKQQTAINGLRGTILQDLSKAADVYKSFDVLEDGIFEREYPKTLISNGVFEINEAKKVYELAKKSGDPDKIAKAKDNLKKVIFGNGAYLLNALGTALVNFQTPGTYGRAQGNTQSWWQTKQAQELQGSIDRWNKAKDEKFQKTQDYINQVWGENNDLIHEFNKIIMDTTRSDIMNQLSNAQQLRAVYLTKAMSKAISSLDADEIMRVALYTASGDYKMFYQMLSSIGDDELNALKNGVSEIAKKTQDEGVLNVLVDTISKFLGGR